MKHIISTIATLIVAFFADYIFQPAWNLSSEGFWIYLGVLILTFAGFESLFDSVDYEFSLVSGISWAVLGVEILLFLILFFAGREVFNSFKYQKYMAPFITAAEFSADMAEEDINQIALMDSASAAIYGNRTLGELSDVISQYSVSEHYSQIALNCVPMKVAPLEHNGLIKAMNNAEEGIPGYVKVNPVSNDAKFVRLEDSSIVYSPSAVFSRDLIRHIRANGYKSTLLGNYFFETDEEENPYWIVQVMDKTIGVFGGSVIKAILIVDAYTGEITYHKIGEIPEWVDIVYDGDYICRKYDDYGLYADGFWNSVIGQKNCKVTTDDYGYKVIGNDVYIYTGVTSVTSDESNVGFILTNSRTLETKYYSVVGAEEYSAMGAAEGEVQQYGYKASFPSLVNVSGEPTYVMVLKDDNGLVKKIAMVNVQQYDIVAVADNIQQASSQYKKLLSSRNVISKGESDDVKTVNTVINSIEYVVVDGSTVVYIKTEEGVFKKEFEESLMLLNDSDAVTISYFETGAAIEYLESVE